MLSVIRFAIALKKRILIFFFVFVWNLENGLQVVFRFLFSVYGIETGNLYFGGSIKETKMAALEDVLCTCHRLAPGVGPRANQGDMSGNTRRWIGFSVPGEGKIRDIVLSSKKKGWGNSKFCKIAATTGIPRGFTTFPNP